MKAVNFLMPIWLIDRLKLVAIAQSYEKQKTIKWTDIVREALAARYPQTKGEKK